MNEPTCGRCGHERFHHEDFHGKPRACASKDEGEQCQGFVETQSSLIPGLECAERIVDARLRTARALNYKEVYRAALEDALVFVRAELDAMKTIEEIREAFERIHGYATGDIGRPYMSIPARPEHDADLILVSAIDELAALREQKASWDSSKVTCAYCGSVSEAPTTLEELQAHVSVCPKHPLAAARETIAKLKGALETVIVRDGNGDRRCKLCGCFVDLHTHRAEACQVAAALAEAK